mmetsp:Transcript_9508/g.38858  ORF Transcript_9508/g.38858 Transcript_9508/m.38858 type:complete len:468 (-) Transcript_9508:401-1804(-)
MGPGGRRRRLEGRVEAHCEEAVDELLDCAAVGEEVGVPDGGDVGAVRGMELCLVGVERCHCVEYVRHDAAHPAVDLLEARVRLGQESNGEDRGVAHGVEAVVAEAARVPEARRRRLPLQRRLAREETADTADDAPLHVHHLQAVGRRRERAHVEVAHGRVEHVARLQHVLHRALAPLLRHRHDLAGEALRKRDKVRLREGELHQLQLLLPVVSRQRHLSDAAEAHHEVAHCAALLRAAAKHRQHAVGSASRTAEGEGRGCQVLALANLPCLEVDQAVEFARHLLHHSQALQRLPHLVQMLPCSRVCEPAVHVEARPPLQCLCLEFAEQLFLEALGRWRHSPVGRHAHVLTFGGAQPRQLHRHAAGAQAARVQAHGPREGKVEAAVNHGARIAGMLEEEGAVLRVPLPEGEVGVVGEGHVPRGDEDVLAVALAPNCVEGVREEHLGHVVSLPAVTSEERRRLLDGIAE